MDYSSIKRSIELPRTDLDNQQIREEQRVNILNSAREVFAQRGSSTTMADVADKAGVSQGLAYRYFASKDEIFSVLFKETMESAKEYDKIIKQLPGTSNDRLEMIVRRLLEMRKEKPGYYKLLYQMLSDIKTPKEIRESVTRRGIVFRKEMRKLLIEGQKAGKIANDDPDQLLEAIMGTIDGLWRRLAHDPQSAEKLSRTEDYTENAEARLKGGVTEKLIHKGVCYDVGRVMLGEDWRPNYDPKIVSRELEIIKNDLHCNAVRIQGLNLDRLLTASDIALKLGLEAWISPEMWDKTQDETLEYLKKAASAVEEIRTRFPERVVFSLGSELTLFTQGFVEGKNIFERLSGPSFFTNVRTGAHNAPLNSFLARANEAVKDRFHGPITYFSLPFEAVDWSPLDFVGVDHYRDARIADSYGKLVQKYLSVHKKPIVIGEFGCCTYRGAESSGGRDS